MSDLSWQDDAACRGKPTEDFFPLGKGNLRETRDAKAFCLENCPTSVRLSCLGYAIEHNIMHGVWGGKSGHQRTIIRSQLRAANEKAEDVFGDGLDV